MHTYTYMHICIYTYIHIYMYVCIYLSIFLSIYLSIYLYIYMSISLSLYIYIYMYIFTRIHRPSPSRCPHAAPAPSSRTLSTGESGKTTLSSSAAKW